ncbi:hypothetical protein HDU76_008116, partial [Blyttiomyces sp. JEL0837]
GQVIEYGTPLELIMESKVGHFRKMCEDTGEMEILIDIAKAAATAKLAKEQAGNLISL